MSARGRWLLSVSALALIGATTACERPPMEVEQGNFRGLAVEQVTNPRIRGPLLDANVAPPPLPPAPPGGLPASEAYQNVQVLGDLTTGEFTRLMAAMTTWVAPEGGCLYCHAPGESLASDSLYTKVVARRMLQMTQAINGEWNDHVGDTGVTCYTCHRGQPVPAYYWTRQPDAKRRLVGYRAGQNAPGPGVGLASLPNDPFSAFLLDSNQIRVQSGEALPAGSDRSIKDAEWTYGFMIHLSESLGVNCTYCHNSRSFKPWEQSSPARVTAWYGIHMARNVNVEYMESLTDVFPDNRKGPEGDVFKVHCETCHQGLNKPLKGVSMLKDYPSLAGAHGLQQEQPAEAPQQARLGP